MTLGEFRKYTDEFDDDVEMLTTYTDNQGIPRIDEFNSLDGVYYAEDLKTGANAIYVLY